MKLALWFWRRLFNFVNVFSLFRNYHPLEKGGALQLNKLESPLPKNALCQVWLKLALWFWRRGFFFKFRYCIFSISLLYPLGKPLNKLEFPYYKNSLCHVALEKAQWFWRRRFFKFCYCIFAFSLSSLLGIAAEMWLSGKIYVDRPLQFCSYPWKNARSFI